MIGKLLAHRARALVARRAPDFVIGDPADPYMQRWWWIPHNRFLNIYVHRVLRSDDDGALHDHHWASLSLMVDTGLLEVFRARDGRQTGRIVDPGCWIYRRANFAHRLVIRNAPAITIFITGPRIREWGFHCPNGWRHWRDFVGADNKDAIGRGCGETD